MIMKKLAIAMMLSVSALAASAQVNYKVQTACHPQDVKHYDTCLLYTSPSPRDGLLSRMPSSA